MDVENLADLPFPNGYIFSHNNEENVITGRKEFTDTLCNYFFILSSVSKFFYFLFFLAAGVVDFSGSGTINGINPDDIITLSGNQEIPGITTFERLEVTDSLDVSIFL